MLKFYLLSCIYCLLCFGLLIFRMIKLAKQKGLYEQMKNKRGTGDSVFTLVFMMLTPILNILVGVVCIIIPDEKIIEEIKKALR